MPLVPLSRLPDSARAWAFGASRALTPEEEERLLQVVDSFLVGWKAHGTPLHAGREWRRGRFLLVAVDDERAPPSGCSIDALVRSLKELQEELGVALVDKAPVWYTDGDEVRAVSRSEFRALADRREVAPETRVFDLSLTRLGQVREGCFELPARESWHGKAFFSEAHEEAAPDRSPERLA